MNFIKKLFMGNADDVLHHKLIRFSRGEYERFLVCIKKGRLLKIKTSYDLVNDIVGIIAEHIGENADVTGKIMAGRDFRHELDFSAGYKKSGKRFVADVEATLTPEQLKRVYERFKFSSILLSINSENFRLKYGKTIPGLGKELKPDFCSAVLPLDLLGEFAFDIKDDFTDAEIRHKVIIDDIVIPDEYKNDFEKARLMARRKGRIVRVVAYNGRMQESSAEFFA